MIIAVFESLRVLSCDCHLRCRLSLVPELTSSQGGRLQPACRLRPNTQKLIPAPRAGASDISCTWMVHVLCAWSCWLSVTALGRPGRTEEARVLAGRAPQN
ncbi:hypothetical protein ABW21_db0203129 [Orbilia brochopaga]|nr:hypothetical protein ABW21_db0203129 [Drechslerella brochopaga]